MGLHSRGLLLEFLATSGDFTRRLTGIEANSKFSTPFAGPEEYFSVSAWPQNPLNPCLNLLCGRVGGSRRTRSLSSPVF